MINFNKVLNYKIISLTIAVLFLFTSSTYGIDLSNKRYLRTPIGQENTYKRIKEAADAYNNDTPGRIAGWLVTNLPGYKMDKVLEELKKGKVIFERGNALEGTTVKINFRRGVVLTYDGQKIREEKIPDEILELVSRMSGVKVFKVNELMSLTGKSGFSRKPTIDEIRKNMRLLGKDALIDENAKKNIVTSLEKLSGDPELGEAVKNIALALLELDEPNFIDVLELFKDSNEKKIGDLSIADYITIRNLIKDMGIKDDTAAFYKLFDSALRMAAEELPIIKAVRAQECLDQGNDELTRISETHPDAKISYWGLPTKNRNILLEIFIKELVFGKSNVIIEFSPDIKYDGTLHHKWSFSIKYRAGLSDLKGTTVLFIYGDIVDKGGAIKDSFMEALQQLRKKEGNISIVVLIPGSWNRTKVAMLAAKLTDVKWRTLEELGLKNEDVATLNRAIIPTGIKDLPCIPLIEPICSAYPVLGKAVNAVSRETITDKAVKVAGSISQLKMVLKEGDENVTITAVIYGTSDGTVSHKFAMPVEFESKKVERAIALYEQWKKGIAVGRYKSMLILLDRLLVLCERVETIERVIKLSGEGKILAFVALKIMAGTQLSDVLKPQPRDTTTSI